jgi:hypothetical protein
MRPPSAQRSKSCLMSNGTILLALPEQVSRIVLVSWLGLAMGVARLDSAFCESSTRSAFLALAYGDGTLYTTKSFPSSKCVKWYLLRNIRVDGINLCYMLAEHAAVREQFFVAQGPHIRWLHISELAYLTPQSALLNIARWCPHVRELFLTTGYYIAPSGKYVLPFAKACSQLDSLKLDSINISLKNLVGVLNACKNLRKLTIAKLKWSTPTEVALPALQELSLVKCNTTDSTMCAIAANCSQLHTLIVFEGSKITDVGVRAVLQGCPLLQVTDVERANVSLDLRVELAKRASLTSIYFPFWPRLSAAIAREVLKVSPSLTRLSLSRACNTDAVLTICSEQCPLLEEITMSAHDNNLTSAGVLQLFKPGNQLRKLNYRGCLFVGDKELIAMAHCCPLLEIVWCIKLTLTDHAVVTLATCCPLLRSVNLEGTSVSDLGPIAIATHCRELTSMILVNCPNITPQGVCAIVEFGHNLKMLDLPQRFKHQSLPPLKRPGAYYCFCYGENK